MQRKFITNLGLLLLLNFLIKPFWIFGIDRTVQNTVSPEDYGVYFALFNFSMLFNILLDLGITTYNNRSIAQNNQLLSKYFSGIVMLKLLLAVLYFSVTFVMGYLAGYDSIRFKMLFFLTINQFLISFSQYLRSNITGLHLFTTDSLLSVLDKSLMIIFCAILLWGGVLENNFSLMNFIYAQTLSYIITSIIIFFIVWIKSRQFVFDFDFTFLWEMVRKTLPYALLVIAMMFYYRLDAIMLDLMLDDGEQQAAIYAQAYRLMDAFIQVPILFSGLLLPIFSYKIKHRQKINELLQLSFEFIFMISITVALIVFFYADEIMVVLYHSEIKSSSKVLQVLIFGFISIAMTNIFGTVLTAKGSLKKLNSIAIGGVVINITLNIFFIPEMKAYGAALASILTHFIVVIAQIAVVVQLFEIKLNWKYLLNLILFIVGLLVVLVILKNYIQQYFVIKVLMTLLIALILSVILKIINFKHLYKVIIDRNIE